MLDFQKYTKVHLMLILSLPGLVQNQNLEIILFCIVVLCTHKTILPKFTWYKQILRQLLDLNMLEVWR